MCGGSNISFLIENYTCSFFGVPLCFKDKQKDLKIRKVHILCSSSFLGKEKDQIKENGQCYLAFLRGDIDTYTFSRLQKKIVFFMNKFWKVVFLPNRVILLSCFHIFRREERKLSIVPF